MKRTLTVLASVGLIGIAMAQTIPPAPKPEDAPAPEKATATPEPPREVIVERVVPETRRVERPAPPPAHNPVEAMRQYLELVDQYTTLAKDPSATGVAAVVTLADLTKQQGTSVAITKLTKLLTDSKDPAVQRAIRLQLIDLYRAAGEPEKAIEQAEILIRG